MFEAIKLIFIVITMIVFTALLISAITIVAEYVTKDKQQGKKIPKKILAIPCISITLVISFLWGNSLYRPEGPYQVGDIVPVTNSPYPALVKIQSKHPIRGTEGIIIPLVPENAINIQAERIYEVTGWFLNIWTKLSDCKFKVSFSLYGREVVRTWDKCTYLNTGQRVKIKDIIVQKGESSWSEPPKLNTRLSLLFKQPLTLLFEKIDESIVPTDKK